MSCRWRCFCTGWTAYPTFEGSPPVVDEHAHLLEHLPDPFDTDRQRTQRREDLGVVHLVARGVPGQDDDQCPADIEPRSPSPAAGLASTVGQVDRPGQPWVAQVGVVALVEQGEVSAGFEQSWLGPHDAGTDGWRRRRLARGASPVVPTDRARGPAALHPVEEQLVALEPAGGCQDRHRAPFPAASELGLIAGLLPTQPAVPVPHRESPVASRALLFPGVFVPPHRARPAATSAQDAPGPVSYTHLTLPTKRIV